MPTLVHVLSECACPVLTASVSISRSERRTACAQSRLAEQQGRKAALYTRALRSFVGPSQIKPAHEPGVSRTLNSPVCCHPAAQLQLSELCRVVGRHPAKEGRLHRQVRDTQNSIACRDSTLSPLPSSVHCSRRISLSPSRPSTIFRLQRTFCSLIVCRARLRKVLTVQKVTRRSTHSYPTFIQFLIYPQQVSMTVLIQRTIDPS